MPDMENGCRRGRVVQSRNCGGVEWLGPTHASRGRLAAASPPGMGIFLQSDRQGSMEDWRRIVQDRAVSLRKGGCRNSDGCPCAAACTMHGVCMYVELVERNVSDPQSEREILDVGSGIVDGG